ncbi:hypothetical protein LTR56_001650 [Elasticomyces elasticus]|nr:hypothetical protein LTR56_001650 [Elasticomyces elasticus]KAK3667298.1 hypothetical protein LTR22_001814 [Elasticomyces elasticus]KAK4932622.1 hypothetical protein LTR49_001046 [Elasticomyces elasticus]KAK5769644.1 hypothetical protein LTS12_000094 [Elasticomyces elasticus]
MAMPPKEPDTFALKIGTLIRDVLDEHPLIAECKEAKEVLELIIVEKNRRIQELESQLESQVHTSHEELSAAQQTIADLRAHIDLLERGQQQILNEGKAKRPLDGSEGSANNPVDVESETSGRHAKRRKSPTLDQQVPIALPPLYQQAQPSLSGQQLQQASQHSRAAQPLQQVPTMVMYDHFGRPFQVPVGSHFGSATFNPFGPPQNVIFSSNGPQALQRAPATLSAHNLQALGPVQPSVSHGLNLPPTHQPSQAPSYSVAPPIMAQPKSAVAAAEPSFALRKDPQGLFQVPSIPQCLRGPLKDCEAAWSKGRGGKETILDWHERLLRSDPAAEVKSCLARHFVYNGGQAGWTIEDRTMYACKRCCNARTPCCVWDGTAKKIVVLPLHPNMKEATEPDEEGYWMRRTKRCTDNSLTLRALFER